MSKHRKSNISKECWHSNIKTTGNCMYINKVINHMLRQFYVTFKFIVWLPHCTAAKTEYCFWFIHSLHFHGILFFLFGDDVEIMWKLSDGITLVTSELAVRSCDCVVVTHTVQKQPISHWSDLALFSWSEHIANQQRQMHKMQDGGVEVGTACDKLHTCESVIISKNWNVKYSRGRSPYSQPVVHRGPRQGQFKTSLCLVWADVGGVLFKCLSCCLIVIHFT